MPWITAALAIAMLGRAPDKPPQEKTIGVHYWLEADDTFLRPGEGTEIYLWVDYDPDAGSPVTYEHPVTHEVYPAKVLWHEIVNLSILCDKPWPETYQGGIGSITSYYQGQLYEYMGTMFEWGIFAIHVINCEPTSGKPGYPKSPVWLYAFPFKPKQYNKETFTFTLDLSTTYMALEVPGLNIFSPNFALFPWSHTGEPPAPPLYIRTGPECSADCISDGVLNIDDFICYQTLFALGDLKADCDADGVLLIDDFICFQTAFVLGC